MKLLPTAIIVITFAVGIWIGYVQGREHPRLFYLDEQDHQISFGWHSDLRSVAIKGTNWTWRLK